MTKPTKPDHYVIFSHGFGVRKDARGMFTEIADSLASDISIVMFDYNIPSEGRNELTIRPFSEQVKILQTKIEEVIEQNSVAQIDLICHSQGCLIAGLLPPNVAAFLHRVILIAPPVTTSTDRMLKSFSQRVGTVIDFAGTSRLARRDGSFSIIPKQYWVDKNRTPEPLALYRKLSKQTDLSVIKALQDEVLDHSNCNLHHEIPNAIILELNGDHDFTGNSRDGLLQTVITLLMK